MEGPPWTEGTHRVPYSDYSYSKYRSYHYEFLRSGSDRDYNQIPGSVDDYYTDTDKD